MEGEFEHVLQNLVVGVKYRWILEDTSFSSYYNIR